MSFDAFLNTGWSEHGDDPQGVFDRLPEGLALADEPGQLTRLAGLATHVAGEHLGRWQDGVDLLGRIAVSPVLADAPAQRDAVHRNQAVLQWASGDRETAERTLATHLDPARPEGSSRVRVLAVATSALAGQRRADEAASTFELALAAAAYGPGADDPAARSLAISGNNLACALEELADRSDAETALMKRAAQTGRAWWEVAGDWRNVMLAEARLAFTHCKAGEPDTALQHAMAAWTLAIGNNAAPDDQLTPLIALTRVHLDRGNREVARHHFDAFVDALQSVDPDVRTWYVDSEAKLRAELAR